GEPWGAWVLGVDSCGVLGRGDGVPGDRTHHLRLGQLAWSSTRRGEGVPGRGYRPSPVTGSARPTGHLDARRTLTDVRTRRAVVDYALQRRGPPAGLYGGPGGGGGGGGAPPHPPRPAQGHGAGAPTGCPRCAPERAGP